jgi:hypothetical protein
MTARQSVALSAPIDPVVAAAMLADWGFLAHPDLPDGAGDAYLLVALRDAPTLRHFDPERVDLWVSRGSRGTRIEITRGTRDLDTEFSWGTISVVDRFGISNDYVTFGGRLTVTEVGDATVVVFVSSAPILRRGGHSQGWDEAAVDLGAFFGRVMIAVDYAAEFERRITESRPVARYAAFVADTCARYRPAPALRNAHPAFWTMLAGEEQRLRRDYPDEWTAGVALAEAAGLKIPN